MDKEEFPVLPLSQHLPTLGRRREEKVVVVQEREEGILTFLEARG